MRTAAKPVALTEVDSYLVIDANGAVTLYSGKVDLGTGVTTALAQMAAEELDVPFARITVVQGDTTLTPEQGSTWGSLSIQVGGIQIRQASAAAKAALIDQAATRLGVKKEQLTVADGVISGGGGRVTYGQLIGGKTFSIKLDPKQPVATKDPKEFKVVGKSVPRIDIPGKVMGTFTYMQDFRVPGMLHARVVRPPAIEAKLESVDEGSIRGISTAKVVRQANFLAVVAENEWAAIKGARMLKATWSKWEGLPEQAKLYEHVRATQGRQGRGDRQRRQQRGCARPGRQEAQRHLRLRHPHARLDGSVVRDRRVQGRQADLVVGLAGDPQPAQAACEDVLDEA